MGGGGGGRQKPNTEEKTQYKNLKRRGLDILQI